MSRETAPRRRKFQLGRVGQGPAWGARRWLCVAFKHPQSSSPASTASSPFPSDAVGDNCQSAVQRELVEPATPAGSMRTWHGDMPHSHESVSHAVPLRERARTPVVVCSTSNANALGSVRAVRAVTKPFASTMAGHAARHSKDASRHLHPESQRAAQPASVRCNTKLNEAAGSTSRARPGDMQPARIPRQTIIARIFTSSAVANRRCKPHTQRAGVKPALEAPGRPQLFLAA